MVMMGDFNYHINWKEMEGERKEDRKFIDMVNDTFPQQHVEETVQRCGHRERCIHNERRPEEIILYAWAKDWQILFNVDKCSVMHMGKGNKKFKYNIGGVTLRASDLGGPIGVLMHSSAKPSRQCVEAANRILGVIKRTIAESRMWYLGCINRWSGRIWSIVYRLGVYT